MAAASPPAAENVFLGGANPLARGSCRGYLYDMVNFNRDVPGAVAMSEGTVKITRPLMFLFLVLAGASQPSLALSLPLVERLECVGEPLKGCMDKLSAEMGVSIDIPSELSGNATYFLAEKVSLDKCINRALEASGATNYALQVDEGAKNATVVLMSNLRLAGQPNSAGGVAGQVPGRGNGAQAAGIGKQERVTGRPTGVVPGESAPQSGSGQAARVAAAPVQNAGDPDAEVEPGMSMRQLNSLREIAELHRPNPTDIVDEIDGKPVTYAELQQITKRMEQVRPHDDDIVDEINGQKMTLKELTDVAKQAEKTYDQQVAKARAEGGSVD